MLLRRISQHVKDQNWFAVFVDFVIVVVGVLFAFQVTEWSTDREDRVAEASAIERLIIEYQENLVILENTKTRSELPMNAADKLRAMIAPEPDHNINDEKVAKLLFELLRNPVFRPNLGTTSSILSSGDLALIQDPHIHRELSAWQASLKHINDWQEIERMHGEELIFGLTSEYVAWPTLEHILEGDDGVKPSRLASDYRGLFSSRRFEGLLHNRWYNYRQSIEMMNELEVKTYSLISLLEARHKELN